MWPWWQWRTSTYGIRVQRPTAEVRRYMRAMAQLFCGSLRWSAQRLARFRLRVKAVAHPGAERTPATDDERALSAGRPICRLRGRSGSLGRLARASPRGASSAQARR